MAKFTERINESSSKGTYSAFIKPTHKRRVAALGTSGLVFGLSLTGNSIALATVEIDCTEENTVTSVADATTNTSAIQSKLASDGEEETVCLSGNFVINDSIDFVGSKYVKGVGESSISNPDGSVFMADPTEATNIITIETLTIKDTVGYGVFAGEVVVTDSSFQNNSQGAILGYFVTVSNSTFIENENISGDDGGAITGLFVTVSNSTFVDNSSEEYGGAIYADATATVSNSTFTGNSSLYGGAIYSGTVDIVNSTFLDNLATGVGSEGGAVYAADGSVYFSTFVNNLASTPPDEPGDTPGNAIYKPGTSQFSLGANIFAGSSPYPQLGFGVPGTDEFTDTGGNVFTTSAETETDILQDPSSVFGASLTALFGTASPTVAYHAPNSSGTQTIALAAGSPAIDVVPFDVTDNLGIAFDQRGASRAHPADSGSFERQVTDGGLANTGSGNLSWISAASAGLIALGGLAVAHKSRLRRRLS